MERGGRRFKFRKQETTVRYDSDSMTSPVRTSRAHLKRQRFTDDVVDAPFFMELGERRTTVGRPHLQHHKHSCRRDFQPERQLRQQFDAWLLAAPFDMADRGRVAIAIGRKGFLRVAPALPRLLQFGTCVIACLHSRECSRPEIEKSTQC